MPQLIRGLSQLPGPGPYEGIVTSHLDTTLGGMIEVSITYGIMGSQENQTKSFPVRYASPFYGITSLKFEGNDSTKYDDVQKSYGMWMIPPDIGTRVLVMFINGDPNQGYWFGCIIDEQQNYMIPGIAASKNTAMNAAQLAKYKTSYLPVAESLKGQRKGDKGPSTDKIARPVHPFADRLLEQGLLLDDVRGTTTSSARREIPSYVFGISTPGPLDKNGPKKPLKENSSKQAPVSRLGGSTFVMDDGDVDGNNELIRLRTRTGHQILLHNTKDLIYIANAKGTAWIELTANGKIDIYSADSISVHTEQDLNFRADRNINFEAGGNINLASNQTIQVESGVDFNLLTGYDTKIKSGNSFSLSATARIDAKSGSTFSLESTENFDIKSNSLLKVGSTGNLHISSTENTYQQSKNFHIKSSQDGYITTGGQIHINGAPASNAEVPDQSSPQDISALTRFALPNRSVLGSWENDFYKVSDLITIMTRVPTHEPYDQHESVNPSQFSSSSLDPSSGSPGSQVSGGVASSVAKTFTLSPNRQGTPPKPTGNVEQDNLQAFLWMIRYAEGTAYTNGYQAQWPSREFDIDDPKKRSYQFKDHPREVRTANGIPSSAAGAYQFIQDTWDECKKFCNLPDFGPASQDKAAIFLLARNNSVEDIKRGDFAQALYKNRKTWASLPGANYPGQGMRSYTQLVQVYKSAGGKLV